MRAMGIVAASGAIGASGEIFPWQVGRRREEPDRRVSPCGSGAERVSKPVGSGLILRIGSVQ
jgi:hypothetical protein